MWYVSATNLINFCWPQYTKRWYFFWNRRQFADDTRNRGRKSWVCNSQCMLDIDDPIKDAVDIYFAELSNNDISNLLCPCHILLLVPWSCFYSLALLVRNFSYSLQCQNYGLLWCESCNEKCNKKRHDKTLQREWQELPAETPLQQHHGCSSSTMSFSLLNPQEVPK